MLLLHKISFAAFVICPSRKALLLQELEYLIVVIQPILSVNLSKLSHHIQIPQLDAQFVFQRRTQMHETNQLTWRMDWSSISHQASDNLKELIFNTCMNQTLQRGLVGSIKYPGYIELSIKEAYFFLFNVFPALIALTKEGCCSF